MLWVCRGLLCVAPLVVGALWAGDGLGLLGLCVAVAALYVVTDQFDEMRGASGTKKDKEAAGVFHCVQLLDPARLGRGTGPRAFRAGCRAGQGCFERWETKARQRLGTVRNPATCAHLRRMQISFSCRWWLRQCKYVPQEMPVVAMGKCGIKPGQARKPGQAMTWLLRMEAAGRRTTLARWKLLRAWRWKRARSRNCRGRAQAGCSSKVKIRLRRRRRTGRPSAPSGRVWSTSYRVLGAEPQPARKRGSPRWVWV